MTSMIAERLKSLAWQKDRLILEGNVFRLEEARDDSWDLGDDCFTLYKDRYLMDQYAKFFASHPEFQPSQMLELGMWDWGSGVFWLECLQPQKYVGVDWFKKESTEYLRQYLSRRDCKDRFRTYWETDQTDEEALRRIVKKEFDGPIDLIIDDASHMYELTKRSFEILFPCLRPGGFYIIEDWAWAHWTTFEPPPNPWLTPTGLTPLITELVEVIGTSNLVLSDASIHTGFAAFRRAPEGAVVWPGKFAIEQCIRRRQSVPTMDGDQPVSHCAAERQAGTGSISHSLPGSRLGRALSSLAKCLPRFFSDRVRRSPR